MTRKDYMRFAEIVREANPSFAPWLASQMARVFAEDNPRFDRQRFFTACEVQG